MDVDVSGFDIGDKHIGDGSPCFIVAEVAQAHEGSLGMAHAYIDAIASTGADAAKFQCHLGDDTSEWRVKPDWPQDENRQAYWKRTGFTADQWKGLKEHCDSVGLIFLCSPFSVEAVRLLDPLVPAWKVPSGEIASRPLLRALRETRKPVIWSTGMATYSDMAVAEFGLLKLEPRVPYAVLQCTSAYPTPPDRVGLVTMVDWREWRYRDVCPVGLSDHSGTIYAGLAAVALGCDVLEVHVCMSRQQFGFDTSSSITIEELAQLVEGARFIEKAKTPVDKDELARELEPIRRLFMRHA